MKKLYLSALLAIFGLAAIAQVSVTFQVDMNGMTVSDNGVHIAGDFQEAAGAPGNWDPAATQMTDDDSDGIYSLTVDLPVGQYEYKFVNGNAWGDDEGVPAINKTGTSDNRFIVVTDYHVENGFVAPAVMYGGTAEANKVALRVEVDMAAVAEISENGVHVAGNFLNPEWEPAYGAMFSGANSKFVYVASVDPDATYLYKFINGTTWADSEWDGIGSPEECTTEGNRSVVVAEEDVSVEVVCYEGCSTCAPLSEVTLTVDMSNVTVSGEVYAAGTFNGYSDQVMADNGDGTYTLVLNLEPGTYMFKFKNGPDGWENVPSECKGEGTNDRAFTVIADEPFSLTKCFEQCVDVCVPNPDPSDITFRVNMENETVSPNGVWVMGSFTIPAWQSGAIEMTDANEDGIYEVTVELSGAADVAYKFANGDPQSAEETGDFLTGGCGVDNGIGGFNRTLVRTGEPMILDIVCYNACVDCDAVGIEENVLGNVSIFPNPSNGTTYIEVQNPNNYTLRMSIVDITGKTVRENVVLNSTINKVNTTNLNSGLYFLNIVNEHNDRSVYKLMVR